MKRHDMPKIKSPFVRQRMNGAYIVIDEIESGYEWVFEDESVMAIEKLHGTNVSIVIADGNVTEVYNRTERIPFINKGKGHIIEGLLQAKNSRYLEFLGDGQHFGELIGKKVNGNPYKIAGHTWIPFSTYAQEHLKYKSWGKYPKDFDTISSWFYNDLIPLFTSIRGNRNGFVEGIVFTLPTSNGYKYAKLRRDMFDWFKDGKRHKQ